MATLIFSVFMKLVFLVSASIIASRAAVQISQVIEVNKAISRGSPAHGLGYVSFKKDTFSYLNITCLGANLLDNTDECGFACLETPSCFSYNVAVFPDINGKHFCELLPSDKYNNSEKLVPSQGHHHFSIASQCSSWPCKNNGKCVSLYEENSYVCVCKEGFTGKNCETNVNECESNPCLNNGTCVDKIKGFNCSCPPGFVGYRCETDIDECVTVHNCSDDANCTNTNGSYMCTCREGYIGDGYNCTDIDECSSGSHSCHSSWATCTNTMGSYSCSCNHPYTGDGRTCNLVSECQNYNSLTSAYRKITYSHHSIDCDSAIGPAWYRYQGAAGSRMVSSCSPTWRCNTHSTGWLNGGHPAVADGQVSRTVCFHWDSNCCKFSTTIQVRNCSSFYVYYLNGTPGSHCSVRYCGTD